ncbi:MAG: hypothetical protein AAF567_14225 [Actinomycetota bacterium]
MTSLHQRFRLAVGLAHVIDDAAIRIHRHHAPPIMAGRHPGAALDLCTLRRLVISSHCPMRPNLGENVAALEVTGSLAPFGADLFRRHSQGREERWFATMTTPDRVHEILDDLEVEAEIGSRLVGRLRPDTGLCVTAVGITADRPILPCELNEVAQAAHAACLVEELLSDPQDDLASGQWRDLPEHDCGEAPQHGLATSAEQEEQA